MKKQKMTADNVEQLMEIVRSLQRGEDPAEAALRRETERVPEADAPMAYLQGEENTSSDREDTEEEAGEKPVRKKQPESRKKKPRKKQPGLSQAEADEKIRKVREEGFNRVPEEWDEDDEFEKFLQEDSGELFGGSLSSERISSALGKVKEFFGGLKADAGEKRRERKKLREQEAAQREVNIEADSTEKKSGREKAAAKNSGEDSTGGKTAASSVSPETISEKEPERRLPNLSSPGKSRSAGRSQQVDDADIRRTERSLLKRRILLRDEDEEQEEIVQPPVEEVNVFERITGLYEESGEKTEEDQVVKETDRNRFPRTKESVSDQISGQEDQKSGEFRSVKPEKESEKSSGKESDVESEWKAEFESGSGSVSDSESGSGSESGTENIRSGLGADDDKEAFGDRLGEAEASATEEVERSPGTASEDAGDPEDTDRPIERRKTAAALRPNPWSGKIDLHSIKQYISDLLEEMRQRGISRREWIMLGAGAIFAVLLIALVFNGITASVSNKEKRQNVTADAGLTVLVEDEPKEWCGSYPVQLSVSASGAEIQKIQINGNIYTADEKGIVTVEADNWLLEAEVETSQGTKNARIEIPWLDGDAPVVNAALSDNVIVLTAADARSTVKKVYYAQVEKGALITLPSYQEYKEPIPYISGDTYYFYAEDVAGNRSIPVVTTMEQAEGLTLRQESMSLFPGETGELMAQAEPSGALLTNLKYESMNPAILSVDSTGRVTALSEGTGTVRVSADKVEPVICTVEVSNTRTVTISTLGDCTLGTDENFNTDTNFNAFEAVNGHSYFFANVKSILEEDDATFANLEGTFTDSTAREAKEYAFKGDTSYTEILKEGSVDVVTLANNHSSDYGAESLTDTQNALREAGIDYCMNDTIVVKEVNGIKTGFIGIYVLNDGMAREEEVRSTIAAAKAQGAQLVIVAFHWGAEKATQPDETQQALAHIAIDCGADLVVGHHPHVLQGVEKYKGKYIAYSLGNFCFGGNSTPSDMTTMIFQQTFSVTRDGVEVDDGVKVIPCSISSTSGYNNYQPTPLTGEEAASVIGRLNEYSAPYGVAFTESGTIEGIS